jgi:ABC-type transport system substrate-binding protein
MAQLGLKININSVPQSELFNHIRSKHIQIYGASWIYDYPDPENGYQLLYGKNISPGPNESNYKNPKFDSLYEKAVTLSDSNERRAIFIQMRRFLEEDIPWIPQVHRIETRLVHQWVSNFKIHAFEYNIEKYLQLDRAMRAKILQ